MQIFPYRARKLHCEGVALADIARSAGTPCYVYSQSALAANFREFNSAFGDRDRLICYAVKANSNLAVLRLFRDLGAGFDIVSGGELRRALRVKADPGKIVFSGVGKTEPEIDLGLAERILQFNVESAEELAMLEARARVAATTARFALRVNPDVDPRTHPYISTGLRHNKFGVPMSQALPLLRRFRKSKHLRAVGIGFHIGSQITQLEPFLHALDRIRQLARALLAEGFEILNVDLGGGLGIRYRDEEPPNPREYGRAIREASADLPGRLILEPGRVLVGNAGALVTRVILTKRNEGKNFIVVDGGMNDLMRPSLYGSYHHILPETSSRRAVLPADVVGPLCESGDFLARDREIQAVAPGDLLALMNAGAYGFSLSSNYNSRPRVAEVLVKQNRFRVIRERESFEDLIRGERTLPF